MPNLTQLLQREAPPKPAGFRLVRPMGSDPTEAGETVYRCSSCGDEFPAEDYYWRRRANGALDRLKACKTCHIARIAAAAAAKKEAP